MAGDDNHDGDHPETSNTTPPVLPPTQQIPHTVSSIKLPILKKGEYDIWAMKMEHYLSHTDYPIWQVIQNGNGPIFVTMDTNEMIKVLPPKTTEEVVARESERKAKTTLLMALPEDHLAKFHKMADAKEMLEAIKSGFDGNDESKKMQKYLLKRQFESFSVSTSEDANQKFLMSLPSSWSQVALIMRNKPGLDTLSFDDLYINLRVFERDVKGTTVSSSSNTQNVAFVSTDNTSSTNDVSTAYSVSSPPVLKSHKEGSSSYTDKDDSKALVTIDGEDIDWSGHVEEDTQNYAMMAYSSSNSSSDNESVFMNKESDLEDTPVNDRYAVGMHAIPPPMIGNYMPSGPDVEIDYFKFTYGPKQTSGDESDSKPSEYASCESDSSVELNTSMPALEENAPKVVCEPKVWSDALIIEEYESDSDDDSVSNVQEDIEKPSFAFTNSVKHVKSSWENIKEIGTPNHSPKVEKQCRNGHTRKAQRTTFSYHKVNIVNTPLIVVKGNGDTVVQASACCTWRNKRKSWNQVFNYNNGSKIRKSDDPHKALKDKGIVDSGCSRNMTGNKAHLADYQEFKSGSVSFGESNGRITGKGKIRLDFEDIYYVEELKHHNLFFVSQRQHNMYSFNLKNIDPSGDLACLFAKASIDESNKWHRRLGHSTTVKSSGDKIEKTTDAKPCEKPVSQVEQIFLEELEKLKRQEKEANVAAKKETTHENQDANINSTNLLNVVSTPVSIVGPSRALNDGEPSYPDDPLMPHLEDIYAIPSEGIFTDSSYDDEGVVIDFNNLKTTVNISATLTTRIHTIHPKIQILGDPMSAVQTRSKVNKNSEAHTLISQALEDESWVDAMQEKLLQFQIQKVWILVDLPFGKK
uniref:Ribonuclease H-like domain-containing protein n=1 Tax=Tanacetum cinerariifolium TaxID=118510 RepID=A0A699HS83_TANCI|nr:ribonuclease H-like domain-containing protein [Tanacetum cinerariifolium]